MFHHVLLIQLLFRNILHIHLPPTRELYVRVGSNSVLPPLFPEGLVEEPPVLEGDIPAVLFLVVRPNRSRTISLPVSDALFGFGCLQLDLGATG